MTVILLEFILLAVGTIVFIIFNMIITNKIKKLKKLKKYTNKKSKSILKPNYDTFLEIVSNQWYIVEKYMDGKQLKIYIDKEDEEIFKNLLEPNVQKLNDIGYYIKRDRINNNIKLMYINNKIVY